MASQPHAVSLIVGESRSYGSSELTTVVAVITIIAYLTECGVAPRGLLVPLGDGIDPRLA